MNIFCDLPSLPTGEPITHAHLHDSNPAEEDWKSLRPYFGWQSEQIIKDTYKVTSRFGGTIPQHDYLKKHFKSRNPVFNFPRRNEPVATDTIFSDTPAINDGSTMAQFFVGRDTLVCDAYGIKSQKQFINTLYDNIRYRGAMTTLITDGGRYEITKKAADLLRSLFIKQYESESYHQHQNKAEQRYGVVKRYINTLMNLTGALAHCWLLCMLYVCNLLNATASPALGGLTPLQALTRQVPDISHFLHFSFWEPIYYKVDESEPDHRFPSQSNEKRGHWVGFADNKGDHLTWKILTDDTYNPKCTHSLMETQCNHSQYPISMKQNCTHNPSTSQVMKSYHSHPVTFPYPPDPGEHVLEMSSAPTTLVERDKLDLSSLVPPKGEMESSFSWTCPFKSPTSSTLCFGEPTLGKLNQETDFYMTKHIPKPSSGVNRVSVSHSSLVTKNGEHFYGENFIHDFPKSRKHIEEVDWGDKLKLNYTTYGYMLMEIDWGGKFNYTSCGCPMTNWQGHETHPTGPKTSEVDWGGHDPNPNHVNEPLLSEVDWGPHNPDADDPEQLTGESFQSFLTFVVQLQWLVALGRFVTHAQVTTLSKLMVASS